jgi:protein gp37
VPEKLADPLAWKKGRRVFVNSMSDLFGEFVLNYYVSAAFGIMAVAKQHTFQVLTKRAERMRDTVSAMTLERCVQEMLRIEPVRVAAAKHLPVMAPPWPLPNVHLGVSVEDRKYGVPRIDHLRDTPAVVRFLSIEPLLEDVGRLDLRGIHQVIVGCESGPGARPMRDDWVRSIRDQALDAGCLFFYKQQLDGRKLVSLPMLDGRQWGEMPPTSAD